MIQRVVTMVSVATTKKKPFQLLFNFVVKPLKLSIRECDVKFKKSRFSKVLCLTWELQVVCWGGGGRRAFVIIHWTPKTAWALSSWYVSVIPTTIKHFSRLQLNCSNEPNFLSRVSFLLLLLPSLFYITSGFLWYFIFYFLLNEIAAARYSHIMR